MNWSMNAPSFAWSALTLGEWSKSISSSLLWGGCADRSLTRPGPPGTAGGPAAKDHEGMPLAGGVAGVPAYWVIGPESVDV